jgi:molybdopterin-guanine dinucleotide biosynthesis protein A
MGRDKAFLTVDGTPLIARQAALLRSLGIDDLIISGRTGVDYAVPGARVVTDSIADAGPLGGLSAIFAAARHPWVLVIAVDLPRLTPSYLQKVLFAGGGHTGVVPHGPHGYEPLVALYPRSLLSKAEIALTAGQFSLQRFIESEVSKHSLIPLEISEIESVQFTNWNTPEDTQA